MGAGKTSKKAKKSSTHKKASMPGIAKGTRTHRELAIDQRDIGRWLRKNIGNSSTLSLKNPAGHKADFLKQVIANKAILSKSKNFGQGYRNRMPDQDELLSTASVRELMGGLLDSSAKNSLSSAQQANANELFNSISRVRMPTKYVGYALKSGEIMQHPTAGGTGYFAESSQTASAHSWDDRQRRIEVTEAMKAATASGHSAEDVVKEGLKAAIAFTLNDMAAPVTASDVKPHARLGNSSPANLNAQVMEREKLKKLFVHLGGKQEANSATEPQSVNRAWGHRRGKLIRTVSAARLNPATVPNP